MRNENNFNKKTYEQAVRMRRIGNRAVQKAQNENRRLKIPNAYSHRGTLYFELPNGELTFRNPFNMVFKPQQTDTADRYRGR